MKYLPDLLVQTMEEKTKVISQKVKPLLVGLSATDFCHSVRLLTCTVLLLWRPVWLVLRITALSVLYVSSQQGNLYSCAAGFTFTRACN